MESRSPMQCDEVRDLFSPLLDRDLAPEERVEAERHLRDCAECAQGFRAMRDAIGALRSLPRHPVARDFAEGVLERLHDASRAAPAVAAPARWAALVVIGVGIAIAYAELRLSTLPDGGAPIVDVAPALERMEGLLRESERRVADLSTRIAEERGAATAALERERRERSEVEAALDRELEELRRRSAEEAEARAIAEAERSRTEREWAERLAEAESGLVRTGRELSAGIARLEERLQALIEEDEERLVAAEGAAKPAPPAKRAELPLQMLREGGKRTLKTNWDHPDAIRSLFDLYESGSSDWMPLAFSALDEHFRVSAADFVTRRLAKEAPAARGRLIDGLFGARVAEPAARDREVGLIRLYKEYWLSERQGAPAPDRGTARQRPSEE